MNSQHKMLLVLGAAVLVGGCALTAIGCSNAKSPSTDQTRAYSRALVTIAETVWQNEAQSCVNVASAANDTALLNDCKAALGPVSNAFQVANTALDSWTAFDQEEYACAAGTIMKGIVTTSELLMSKGAANPPILNDLNQVAGLLNLTCAVDAGAPSTSNPSTDASDAGVSID